MSGRPVVGFGSNAVRRAAPSMGGERCSAADFAEAGLDGRVEAISELAGLLAAVQAVLGSVIVAADEARDWVEDGALDVSAWLVARCGLTTPHAREWVRAAHALEGLPALRALFASGAVSWDQVRPITRFATAETDAELAERLPGLSAAQCEALARLHRPIEDEEADRAHTRRSFTWRPDHRTGGYRYHGFLPADMGATVNALLTGVAEKAGPAPETGLWEPFSARCADALHGLCDDPDTTRAEVAIHVPVDVDLEVLTGEDRGNGLVADEVAVGRATVLRYLCDGDISHTIETADGLAVGIGRRDKVIPRWLRRHVIHRDRTCRFPGCERVIRQVHHVRHWTAHQGPTDSPNLAGLCWAHHQLVHEGRWLVAGDANGELSFTSPYGRVLTSRRQPIRPHTASRARGLVAVPLGGPGRDVERADDGAEEDGTAEPPGPRRHRRDGATPRRPSGSRPSQPRGP